MLATLKFQMVLEVVEELPRSNGAWLFLLAFDMCWHSVSQKDSFNMFGIHLFQHLQSITGRQISLVANSMTSLE